MTADSSFLQSFISSRKYACQDLFSILLSICNDCYEIAVLIKRDMLRVSGNHWSYDCHITHQDNTNVG